MAGTQTISTSETKAEALTLQSSAFGVTKAVVHGRARLSGNLAFYGGFRAVGKTTTSGGKGGVEQSNTTYTYRVTLVMMICEGGASTTGVLRVWRGKSIYTVAEIGASPLLGGDDQEVWGPLTTLDGGAYALSYSGMVGVVAQDYDLGSSAQVENHSFEVQTSDGCFSLGGSVSTDADPALILTDWLTNKRWGMGMPASVLGDLSTYSAYCRAAGLLLSPALTEQAAASDRIKTLCEMTNARVVRVDGKINVVPLGDEPLTGNGATYTPDLTPIYDLTGDHFLADPGMPAVRIKRKTPADAYNSVKVEYLDRANDYNTAVATAQDQASIEQYGLKVASTLVAHWVCDGATADLVAQIALRRFRYILNTYTFQLPWNFARLVPTNIVTLTDDDEGLDRTPVRITTISEDESGFSIEAEDFPHAVAGASSYPLQALAGFKHDYSVAPGDALAPVFIEPPVELTSTGLEVWIATTGTGANWGGCHVWVSMTGANYKRQGTIYKGARFGTLSGPATSSATTLGVDLTDNDVHLLNSTAADALALNTLCMVRDTPSSVPELLAYTTATLTGPGMYTLGGLVRGAYGTDPAAHAATATFVRLDDAVVRGEPMQPDMVGKTLYVKLQAFNIYGLGMQDLADVAEYTYVITGQMLNLPPSDVTGLTAVTTTGGVLVSWSRGSATQYLRTEVRTIAGTSANWAGGTKLNAVDADSLLWPWPANGTYTVMAKHVDAFGAYSENLTSVEVTVTGASINVGTEQINGSAVTETAESAVGYYRYNNAA